MITGNLTCRNEIVHEHCETITAEN
jgi:hypothetical protein